MQIGRYQIVEKLGQGGMGVVYRAFDTLLQRDVALKLISGSLEAGAEQRERFLREARAAGQLSHRNIITIHDLGEHEGQPYLAMEYLEGEDLQRRLTRKDHMSLGRKVELVTEICEALEYAHARGIVHRDIKPANVFIAANGTARIVDFGLARLITSELTNSNVMMGTVNYMAPEQVRGERADHRSDIFSVGAVMYELLGGRRAFDADSFASTMYKILHEAPEPLHNIDPSLPHELIAIADRALAKPRDERYQSMSEMLRDLAVFRQQMIAYDSPAFGRPAFGSDPRASDPPMAVHASSDVTMVVPTTAQIPAPAARASSGSDRAAAVVEAAAAGSGATPRTAPSRTIWMAAAAAVALVALVALWLAFGRRGPEAPPTTPSAIADASAIATAVRQATQALESGDFAGARRHAEAALALAPGDAEALRIRDRAASAQEGVTRGLREARDHYEAGRFEEASRAAGNVLSLAPANAEARKLMQDAAARSQGRGAEAARSRMRQAKAAASGASASKYAAASYNAALGAERTAERLYDAGQLADATAKFYEASGLFRSAELAAQTEAAARAERAAAANAEKEREEQERAENERAERERAEKDRTAAAAREAAAQPLPTPPAARPLDPKSLGTANVPTLSPPARPTAPAAAPAQPPQPPAEKQILDLLSRYEAALESRSLDALKRVWPGLSGSQEAAIRDEFQHGRRIQVDIVGVPRITATGAAATATFLRRYRLLTIDGQTLDTQSVATMTCRRTAAGWVVEQIRFELVR